MGSEERQQTNDTARLETFADGVMAIAITLLILEVRVPHVEGHSLASALAHQWPSYVGYVVSFLTIGIIWVNHHHMFRLIERTTHTFLMLNVVFLMTICILPWPTALVADYARDAGGRTAATAVYGGVMTAVAIMFNVVWRYAATGSRLLVPGLGSEALAKMGRNYLAGPAVYGTATVVAFVEPFVSLAIFGALAVYWLLPGTGPRAEALTRAIGDARNQD
jgi:TMEM175 potassium channel family protein